MAIKEAKAKKDSKEITLLCSNKSLTISHLGVQFKEGKFVTTDRTLANIVLKYAEVFEV